MGGQTIKKEKKMMKKLYTALVLAAMGLLFSACSSNRDNTKQIVLTVQEEQAPQAVTDQEEQVPQTEVEEENEDPLSYYIEHSRSIAWDYLEEAELVPPEEVENLSSPHAVYLVRIAEINGYSVASYVGPKREALFFCIHQVGGKYDPNTNVLWIDDTPIDIADIFSRYLRNENAFVEDGIDFEQLILRDVLKGM